MPRALAHDLANLPFPSDGGYWLGFVVSIIIASIAGRVAHSDVLQGGISPVRRLFGSVSRKRLSAKDRRRASCWIGR
jgi:hypothetical protein